MRAFYCLLSVAFVLNGCARSDPLLLATRSVPVEIQGARLLDWITPREMLITSPAGFALIDPETQTVAQSIALPEQRIEALQAQRMVHQPGTGTPPGLKLPGTPPGRHSMGLRVTRDRGLNRTFWYSISHFDANPDEWKLRLWTLNDDQKIEAERDLPAGPWVYKHGLRKVFKCFSCGCSCYEKAELKVSQGQIFLAVWDSAVEEEHAGIYTYLEAPGQEVRWIRVQAGQIDSFAVAPGGRAVAHIAGGQLYVTSLTRQPATNH